ncbi:MAG: response regulator, partial [Firmicutes bacterium]|nr:response regulator [Bacillota bacterium]
MPLRILVVDDQPRVCHLLEAFLRQQDHVVYSASNGLEALELVERVRPHLVFLDIRMPRLGGLEALDRIKSLWPDVEVVMMTAYGGEGAFTRAYQQGAFCCLTKPFDLSEVAAVLRAVEERWRERADFLV